MKLTDSILERYRRWRHRRGYGVHSPYAYTLIREALFPARGYAYYADEDPRIEPRKGDCIERNRGGSRGGNLPMKPEILLRLALQLACDNIRSACYIGDKIHSCYRFALQSAGLRIYSPSKQKAQAKLSDSTKTPKTPIKSAFFIAEPGEVIPAEALEEGNALLLLNPGEDARCETYAGMERLGCGLILDSRRYLIAIPRREMRFTHYHL